MDAYLLDWVNLLLRWAHVITAIAWIGSSFYFVLLDNSLTPPAHHDLKAKGVDGELWAVHGGGFYHPQKYLARAARLPLPADLHWSYWESYSTWLTGFALFTVLYLFNAGTFLVDKSRARLVAGAPRSRPRWPSWSSFWIVYDVICRMLRRSAATATSSSACCVCVFVVAATWLACQLFAGRAAFLLVGAMLATTMSANVFFWIIPGQRKVVAAAARPASRSTRSTASAASSAACTTPTSRCRCWSRCCRNHYGWLYQGRHNWLVLVLLMLAGALIRHSFVARHKAARAGTARAVGARDRRHRWSSSASRSGSRRRRRRQRR